MTGDAFLRVLNKAAGKLDGKTYKWNHEVDHVVFPRCPKHDGPPVMGFLLHGYPLRLRGVVMILPRCCEQYDAKTRSDVELVLPLVRFTYFPEHAPLNGSGVRQRYKEDTETVASAARLAKSLVRAGILSPTEELNFS